VTECETLNARLNEMADIWWFISD